MHHGGFIVTVNLRPYTCVLLLTATSGWAAFAAEAPAETFAPLPPGESQAAVLPPASAPAATELSAAAGCHSTKHRAALVALSWRPASAGSDGVPPEGSKWGLVADQRVELTKFRDGFRTGRFQASRQLAAAAESVAVDSPETGINYYWRVLTLTAQGWAPSATGRFEVPICPWDEPDLSHFEAVSNDHHSDQGARR